MAILRSYQPQNWNYEIRKDDRENKIVWNSHEKTCKFRKVGKFRKVPEVGKYRKTSKDSKNSENSENLENKTNKWCRAAGRTQTFQRSEVKDQRQFLVLNVVRWNE